MIFSPPVYQLWCPPTHKITLLPIVLGRSPAFFHLLFSFIYFHLFMFSDGSVIFSQFIGFDVHRPAKFQLSMSHGRYQSLISVSKSASESVNQSLSDWKELYIWYERGGSLQALVWTNQNSTNGIQTCNPNVVNDVLASEQGTATLTRKSQWVCQFL